MINHVVLFKFKAFPADEKQAKLSQLKNALLGLKDKIAELQHLEVGTNHELDAKSYDLCLISHFNSLADLKVYAVHPEHLKVLELVKAYTELRAAVDYEF
ncbi:Dabb family protein [Mangrovibacterium marinum]|uniref:Stress responsive alpha/beta barrel protein n=1 Tax=Mangrovibacterium marinum TaxID=1639118 RepID=A0A2T5C5A2_9BACT|nr:Dabb family protein [Mangrovibacterium marinum]PTN10087.1 stress responsive alpha/beta barrel protein [Mangrovibacterium marinum]